MRNVFERCLVHLIEWVCFALAMLSMCFLLYLGDTKEAERYSDDVVMLEQVIESFGNIGTVSDIYYCTKHRRCSVYLKNPEDELLLVAGNTLPPRLGERWSITVDTTGNYPVLALDSLKADG